jgi:TBC1 domain family member 2
MAGHVRSGDEESALRQVAVDVPRTAPGVPFFQHPAVQKSLERILYIWGIRHPASGYVQGINDLVTPFLAVFVGENFSSSSSFNGGGGGGSGNETGTGSIGPPPMEDWPLTELDLALEPNHQGYDAATGNMPGSIMDPSPGKGDTGERLRRRWRRRILDAEADCYWCLCSLLDGIQDNYTYAQPGIQKTLFGVRELVRWGFRKA